MTIAKPDKFPPPASTNLAVAPSSAQLPLIARMALEIQKPKDWQAFQRNCVLLFRNELRDPHTIEYGRNGQTQYGIDILACRDEDPNHGVAIQCRLYKKPLKYAAMLKDCRDAARHFKNLREFIFASTSPDDARAIDAARQVQDQLTKEGFTIRIIVYGWEQLQLVIARHPEAYDVFTAGGTGFPAPPPEINLDDLRPGNSLEAIADRLIGFLGSRLPALLPPALPNEAEGLSDPATEDPVLHARIDGFRDLLSKHGHPDLARNGLLGMKAEPGIENYPRALYRIEANLGAVEYQLGHLDRAVVLFEAAYAICPHEPAAKAHLALARLLQGNFSEAMSAAREALAGTPRPELALTCLMQAATLSGSTEDPSDLIPAELKDSVAADLGLAEAYRKRQRPGWQTSCIALAQRHIGIPEFVPINAVAVLSLATETEKMLPGGVGPVSAEQIIQAAEELCAFVGHLLDIKYSDQDNLRAHINNACVLLRLCGRYNDIELLLKRAPNALREDPLLRLQMAVALAAGGRPSEAIILLEGDTDAQNQIFRIQLLAGSDSFTALNEALSLDEGQLSPDLSFLRWNLIAEAGLATRRLDVLPGAISALRRASPSHPAPAVFELRKRHEEGLADEEFRTELANLADALGSDAPMEHRCFLAAELDDAGLAEKASLLLDDYVDLNRPTATAVFYLRTLAAARRDEAFYQALEKASPRLRALPAVLWGTAAHAWNIGHLESCRDAITSLAEAEPDNLAARLFKIQVLLRQNKRSLVEVEVQHPLEAMKSTNVKDRLEVIALLCKFNYRERAAILAYKMFLEHRDNPRVWMSLTSVVLGEGTGAPRAPDIWAAEIVAPHIAVDVAYDDGSTNFFIVEPDAYLRRLDGDAREPTFPLVKQLMGLATGAEFSAPNGRRGKITRLRHKVVARFHKVLEEFEARFPGSESLKSISVAPGEPGGLDEMMAILKARAESVKEELDNFRENDWPLAVLAARLGLDVIDAAEGLVSQGGKLKTADGSPEERVIATRAISANNQRGMVLDLHSFWTAWRLGILDTLELVGGPIHVGQQVLDRMRARRDKLMPNLESGTKHAHYENGRIVISEFSASAISELSKNCSLAVEWMESRATICPLIAGDDLPDGVRELLGQGATDIFDALVIAQKRDLLLLSDDIFVRRLGHFIGFDASCWTQAVLLEANARGHITRPRYIQLLACLIEAGHSYLSITSTDLADALELDATEGKAPGRTFAQISKSIGGEIADPASHVRVVFHFLLLAWRVPKLRNYCKGATSHLLRQMIRCRYEDYGEMLRALFHPFHRKSEIGRFLRYWQIGHFITDEAIFGSSTAPSGASTSLSHSSPASASSASHES
ncbi:tetratricopeptide repeat protein [Roseomonas sp. F4]